MALGDGSTWDETTPTDATLAINIDDYNRDVRVGIRSRMALEHEFPSSQSATAEGGRHKLLTLQRQTSTPTSVLSGTQVGVVYVKTMGTTGDALCYLNAATQEVNLSRRLYFWYLDGAVESGTNVSATLYLVSAGKILVARGLAGTAPTGSELQVDIRYNGSSIWTATSSQVILAAGSTSTSVTGFVTTNVTAGGTFIIDVDKVGTSVAGGNLTVMVEVG
jgi:hypothetical protein